MNEYSPVRQGLLTLRLSPWLVLLPLGWDVVKWGFALWWNRWAQGPDLSIWEVLILTPETGGWLVWLVGTGLHPSLPGAQQAPNFIPVAHVWPFAAWMILPLLGAAAFLAVDGALRGGFLSLLNGRLHGVRPSLEGFRRAAGRFWFRFFLLAMLLPGLMIVSFFLISRLGSLGWVPVSLLAVAYYMAQLVMVTEDVGLLRGLVAGPLLLVQHVLPLGLVAVVATALWAGTGYLWGYAVHQLGWPVHPLLVAPLLAVIGTFQAAGLLAACQSDAERDLAGTVTRSCAVCGSGNSARAACCVTCGEAAAAAAPQPIPVGDTP